MKDPVEIQPPGRDRIFISPRVDSSRDCVPFALLDDVPLDFGHSPAIGSPVSWTARRIRRWIDSRRQLPNRLEHRLTEPIHSSSAHPSVEGFAYIGASQPEVDVVGFVNHRVLVIDEPRIDHRRRRDAPLSLQEEHRRCQRQPLPVSRSRSPLRDSRPRWPHSTMRGHCHPGFSAVGNSHPWWALNSK